MCFILAIIGKDGLSPSLLLQTPDLLRMAQARGPDDTNSERVTDRVFLGSNRLSIIDFSPHGQMPMKSLEGDYWIVYNGELYNHDELRRQLVAAGLHFRSRSDTEVVLNAYVYWGEKFVDKLNGIFAFVIFDKQQGRLITARDRFGAKPLHYTEMNGHVIFSSDYRILQSVRKPLSNDLDPGAVTAYMHCRFVPGDRSVINGVFKLRPGEIKVWDVRDLSWKSRIFWKPRYSPEPFRPEVFFDKLLQAIHHTSVGDVHPGLLLSGGLDSSAVAALMSQLGNEKVQTYGCTYAGQRTQDPADEDIVYSQLTNSCVDEDDFAKTVASAFGYQHHTSVIDPTIDFGTFLAMQSALGEPLASTDAIGHFAFARSLAGKTKMVISGTGSDELLGGYEQMYFKTPNPRLATLQDPLEMLRLFSNMDGGRATPVQFLDRDVVDEHYVSGLVTDTLDNFPTRDFPHEVLNQVAFFELAFGLPGWELDQADRLYMDRSIELRPAFLENGFVDYALTVPSELKRDKLVLKQAMRGRLPDTIVNRPKYPSLGTPPSVYGQPWFKEGLRDLFDHPLDIWDKVQIGKLSKQDPRQYNLDIVYRLVYLQTWHRHCASLT